METKINEDNPFITGPIYRTLLRFMVPVMLALLLQALYSSVDLIVIGRFVSEDADITQKATSAVGTGSTIMVLVTYVITGLAMGTTVVLGKHIGEKNEEACSRTIGAAICVFIVLAILLTIIMECGATAFARLMNAPSVEMTALYLRICGIGSIFIVAYNVISAIFRGIGDSRHPLIFVAIACVVNIVTDLVTVTVFGWGVAGVAFATIFAQAVSVVLSFVFIRKLELPFSLHRNLIRFHRGETFDILKTGIPLSLQDFLTNMSFIIINTVANKLGPVAALWPAISAGYSVDSKIAAFTMVLPSAFLQSMAAFTAQNIGAGTFDRAKKGLRYMILTGIGMGICLAALCEFGGGLLARVFTNETDTIFYAAQYLKGYALDCLVGCVALTMIGYFSGSGHSTFVMIQGLIGAFLVRIPVVLLLSRWQDVTLFHIGIGCATATITTLILSTIFYFVKGRNLMDKGT